jgi:hypothetical protein
MGTLRSSCWRLLTISSVMRWQPLDRVLRGVGCGGRGVAKGRCGQRRVRSGKAPERGEVGRSADLRVMVFWNLPLADCV